jgi:hypothetical protein
MKTDKTAKSTKIVLVIGLVLFGLTLLLNERIMAGLFPAYRLAIPPTLKVGLFVADVLFVLVVLGLLLRRKSRTQILLDVAVGLGFTLFLLAGIEAGFYLINRSQNQLGPVSLELIQGGEAADVRFQEEHSRALYQRDDWLGYRPVPNTRVRATRQKADQTLYDVVYTIDASGRRATPVDQPEAIRYHILFFGGSYTFGEGVDDNQTMPAYVSRLAPEYRAYNYGAGGYGPQQMLARLQSDDFTAEIDEPQGVLIYTFIIEHIDRVIGSMNITSQRGEVMPYYFTTSTGELVRDGTLASGRPLQSILYSVLGKSQTLRFFNIDFPLNYSDDDLKTTAGIIDESRRFYQAKFNSDRFYVLIYPGLGYPDLLPHLEAAGIPYLDYSDLPQMHNDDFWLGEGHPSAKGHRIVAARLVQDLGLAD